MHSNRMIGEALIIHDEMLYHFQMSCSSLRQKIALFSLYVLSVTHKQALFQNQAHAQQYKHELVKSLSFFLQVISFILFLPPLFPLLLFFASLTNNNYMLRFQRAFPPTIRYLLTQPASLPTYAFLSFSINLLCIFFFSRLNASRLSNLQILLQHCQFNDSPRFTCKQIDRSINVPTRHVFSVLASPVRLWRTNVLAMQSKQMMKRLNETFSGHNQGGG